VSINFRDPSQLCLVDIRGRASTEATITSLGTFNSSDSNSFVLLRSLRVSGNMSSITTNSTYNCIIGGDVTGSISLLQAPAPDTTTPSQLGESGEVAINDRLLGPITVQRGFIDQLTINGGIVP